MQQKNSVLQYTNSAVLYTFLTNYAKKQNKGNDQTCWYAGRA